jgi:hypothetical protein
MKSAQKIDEKFVNLRFTASQNLVNLPILIFAGITQYMVLFSPPLRHIVYFEIYPPLADFARRRYYGREIQSC